MRFQALLDILAPLQSRASHVHVNAQLAAEFGAGLHDRRLDASVEFDYTPAWHATKANSELASAACRCVVVMIYRRVWCAYITTAREVGLIIQVAQI